MKYDRIQKVFAHGTFVLTVSEGTLGGRHTSFYGLLRVQNGKIAEHWDVIEPIAPRNSGRTRTASLGSDACDRLFADFSLYYPSRREQTAGALSADRRASPRRVGVSERATL